MYINVVHGEEGEAVAVPGLSSGLSAGKTVLPSNHLQGSTIHFSAKDLSIVAGLSTFTASACTASAV